MYIGTPNVWFPFLVTFLGYTFLHKPRICFGYVLGSFSSQTAYIRRPNVWFTGKREMNEEELLAVDLLDVARSLILSRIHLVGSSFWVTMKTSDSSVQPEMERVDPRQD